MYYVVVVRSASPVAPTSAKTDGFPSAHLARPHKVHRAAVLQAVRVPFEKTDDREHTSLPPSPITRSRRTILGHSNCTPLEAFASISFISTCVSGNPPRAGHRSELRDTVNLAAFAFILLTLTQPTGEWLFFGFLQAENFEAATVAPGQTHRRIAASASWSRLKRRRMDALQETPRSPQEQPLVHTDEESATETTQMDVQTWLPQGSSEEVDNVSAGERHDGAAWTEDGWHTVLTRRQKKNQKKNQKNASEAVECNASSSSPPKQGSQVKRRRRTRSRRPLPPLPKDDIKIILRPHKGLAVKDILGYELSTAVIDACHRHFDGGSFMLRVHPGSNIIIVSTPHEHVAKELREITHLNIRGRVHSFNSYVADPEDVLRGIVHGIPSGTSQAELMANLRVRTQGVKIERARMLGSTKTAIITFTGSTLPRCVYFMGAEAICYPHKPTRQACKPANTVSWTRIVSPSAPLIENPEYQKMVAENKQLALENEKLRCQIKEERREFHKIISSLETKLEARLNALEANNNATHAISRATVAHSLEGGTAKVDIPQRFSEEAHVSQLQMEEQLQSLRNLMRELQSQQQRAASELREQMMQQMHQMFSEYRKEFAAETEQQRRYVNDSVVGIQRAINKRVSVTSASSPLPKDRRITEKADTPQ
ncbi:hypothetical protein HPB51_016606 [Rhipicephalus microplus]|uniref:Uncharacterized protein n=1 Tax=Rhipicephalus microplus TaxID=6941 RepID=A0A9J6EHN7_RHIMP|nr:hypothetical protein HPB51_016606 [Rhipicephalus microplus]